MAEAESQFWNGVADRWAHYADSVDRQAAAATEVLLDAAAVGPGSSVLDLGCGPGGAGLAAARRTRASGRVVFADVAPAMLDIVSSRCGGLPGTSVMTADLGAVAAPDGSFDAVVCRYALMFAEDPVVAVGEAVRVLRPSGRYAALTFAEPKRNRWQACVLDAVSDVLAVPVPPPPALGPFSLTDPAVLAAALRRGGLIDVHVEEVASPMIRRSLAAWWEESSQLAGPIPLILAGLDPAVRDAVRQRALEYAGKAASVDETGAVHFEGFDLLGWGRRP